MVQDIQNTSTVSEGDDNGFEVEAILAHKTTKKGETFYLVKWKAFNVKGSTWEPLENLAGCEAMISIYMRNPRPNTTKGAMLDLIKKNPKILSEAVEATAHLLKSNTSSFMDEDRSDEDMKIRGRKSAFERSDVLTSFEKTTDKSFMLKDLSLDDNDKLKPPKIKGLSTKDQPVKEFNYKLFLKLGFSVSALIILGFIIFHGGFDHRHYQKMIREMTENAPKVTKT